MKNVNEGVSRYFKRVRVCTCFALIVRIPGYGLVEQGSSLTAFRVRCLTAVLGSATPVRRMQKKAAIEPCWSFKFA